MAKKAVVTKPTVQEVTKITLPPSKQGRTPSRPKLLKDLDKLPKDVQAAIKAEYPNGFSHKLVSYTTPKGEKVLALPFDTEEFAYLVRVTVMDSKNMTKDDEDDDLPVDKVPRDGLDLDGLDLDGLAKEDDTFSKEDDDDDEYISPRKRRGSRDDDDDDDDGDDY
ncbi:MAG: hypothetical protein U5L45_02020 [Saprospiraceae bacterium]|nr:hypothetical protein [Saprospiraceae bacterium]